MPRFKYTALAEGGEEISGEVESISEAAARGMLLRRNLEVTEIAKARKKFSEIEITSERVPPTEIMHFSRQLGAFVRAGIPIADGLDAIADSTGTHSARSGSNAARNTRTKAANAAAFTAVDMKPVTIVGAPS